MATIEPRDEAVISIDNIKHFLAVVENEGVIRASEKLFLSPSSLTRSVQQIESVLGKPLFDRVSRRLQLNEEGEVFFSRAKELVYQYAVLLNEDTAVGGFRGHYRIGASHFLARSVLAGLLFRFGQRYPDASLEVYSLDSSVLMRKLHLGEIDVGLSFSPKLSENLDKQVIKKGRLVLCVGDGHPLVGKPFTTVKSKLGDYPAIIHRPTDSVERCDEHPMFKRFKIAPKIEMYWDSDSFACGVLQGNKHWTMLPELVVEKEKNIQALSHPREWEAPYEVSLVWNKRKAVGELKDTLLEML